MIFVFRFKSFFLVVLVFGVISYIFLGIVNDHVLLTSVSFAVLRESMPNGTEKKPDFLTDSFLKNHRDGRLPYEGDCHYLGLRRRPIGGKVVKNIPTLGCKPHRRDPLSCKTANRYSGEPGYVEHRQCDEPHHPPICHFVKVNITSHKLFCNPEVCRQSPVRIGSIDPQQGIVTDWKQVEPFSTDTMQDIVDQNTQHGFEFCFMKCGDIFQVLVFPPAVKRNSAVDVWKRINFNFIVLDSTSRPHFYRMLPKSVAALRAIVYDDSVPATALDFEMFQAISQHTFDNIRPLFSGIVKGDKDFSSNIKRSDNPLGIPVLFGKYKKSGYQTMFQEDLCWHDHSGIMLTDIEPRNNPGSPDAFKTRWKEFAEKVSKYHVDKYGLTHFSCQVCLKYGKTNIYEDPDKVCLNGKFFSSYFLDYIAYLYEEIQHNDDAAPMISYTHFNIGHVGFGGDRIRNIDSSLAEFLTRMAYNPYTVTVLLSDHGHTRTRFAKTFEGRLELYDPLLFTVLPYYATKLLGRDRVAALVENQGRLFTTADIYQALMSLHDPLKSESRDPKVAGIFAILPGNRSCADLPLMPLTRCKCEGWDEEVATDNLPKHKWLAEFALGQLNNAIQEQYMKAPAKSTNGTGGYGSCKRLVGKSYGLATERQFAGNIVTSLDLHVSPLAGQTHDEVFRIEVQHPMRPTRGVQLNTYIRQSLYSKFKFCVDKYVDIKLCVCEQRTKGIAESEKEMKTLIGRPMFGATTELKDLNSGCLYLLTRRHKDIAIVYEVANICLDKTFRVTIGGSSNTMLISSELPVIVVAKPRTIHFVLSAVRYVMNESFFNMRYEVEVVK